MNKPCGGIVYSGRLIDLLELDLVIFEIIYERDILNPTIFRFFARNRPSGNLIPIRTHRFDIEDEDNNDNNEDNDVHF